MSVHQLNLDLPDLVHPEPNQFDTLDDRFDAFHKANPWVADRLEQMTDDLVASGATKVGVKMLFEVLRWQSYLRTNGDDYKLNNSYCSRYARLLIDRRPEWAHLFELRRLHGGVS